MICCFKWLIIVFFVIIYVYSPPPIGRWFDYFSLL